VFFFLILEKNKKTRKEKASVDKFARWKKGERRRQNVLALFFPETTIVQRDLRVDKKKNIHRFFLLAFSLSEKNRKKNVLLIPPWKSGKR